MVRNPFGHLLDWYVFIFGPVFFSDWNWDRFASKKFWIFEFLMTEISAFSNRKSGFNENHSAENNNSQGSTHQAVYPRISDWAVRRWSGDWIPCDSCTNNNCSITVYFCEDIPVTTKALAREIVKKSQIQKTSGTGIVELSINHVLRSARFGDPW